jgi:hypothetical protein
MKTTPTRRMATCLAALALLYALPGCLVEPFGRDGGGERGEHGERRSREHYVPSTNLLPSTDAGDSSEYENVGLPSAPGRQGTLAPGVYRSAVYLLPLARPAATGLWG